MTDYMILTLNRRWDELKRPDGSNRQHNVYVIFDTAIGAILPNRYNWDTEGWQAASEDVEALKIGDRSVVTE